jgi:CubicO group peptidase (beta-lactamase class C family)
MNHVIAVILAKERRMVSRMRTAGAVGPERARPLEDLGIKDGIILHRLRDRAVIRHTPQNRYYLDEESWNVVRRERRRAMSVIVAIAVAILLAIVFSRRAYAQPRAEWPAVDAAFAEMNRNDSPGCALGVFEAGKITYERGYGMASLEHDVPITPETVFYVGSVSKQFTAFAAALAIQHGRLSADDPIRKWLPELPAYANEITVRHLLHHTSGLRDYNTLLSIAGRRGDEAYDNPTVLRMTARQKALNFPPGTEYLYSNTGYTLLATIVERAMKTPFAAFADAEIFKPLGMTVTHYHTDSGRLVKWRAMAYDPVQGGYRLVTPSNERAGAGGVFTNVRELLEWDENFFTGAVGGRRLIEQVQTPGALNDGTRLNYAWGLTIGDYRGLPIVEHSGSLGGYRAHTLRFPRQHTSFVALCNLATSNPGSRLRRVAGVVLEKQFTEPAPAPQTAAAAGGGRGERGSTTSAPKLDPSTLASYAGTYQSQEIDVAFTISVKDGQLMLERDTDAEPAEMRPTGADTFRVRGFVVRFERSGGRVTALVVDAGRVRGIEFRRTAGGRAG